MNEERNEFLLKLRVEQQQQQQITLIIMDKSL